ncbi:MAG: ribonuclease HII [Patescibacteria group bacterium]|nr:ribonuclease HII [Patescibacteria group bacterium]
MSKKRKEQIVIGLDEVGRGSLAGPLVAAGAMIKFKIKMQNLKLLKELKDSKKLTPKKREEFYKIITKSPFIEWGIGKVSEKVIDKINILEATKLAMERAIRNLEKKLKKNHSAITDDRPISPNIDFLILDGNFKINLPIPQKSVIKGDEKVFLIKLASIVAKVTRDRMMKRFHRKYPQYRFDKHKGYGTKLHFERLKKYGPGKIHRKTFKPVKENQKLKIKLKIKDKKHKLKT